MTVPNDVHDISVLKLDDLRHLGDHTLREPATRL